MTVYKVFYKDYYRRKFVLLGTLIERRKELRGMSPLESGLKWAKSIFGGKVQDTRRILVVPKDMKETSDTGTTLSQN